ncbi:MAG TPA: PEPxxWA-CTERM sorting domain-containing protein [Phenylobacterium sp.]|nr:PEPxxWA-CTERM sorting domain-containing protein [Phenylobacterium sp.]
MASSACARERASATIASDSGANYAQSFGGGVPEPATWALVFSGFFGLGAAMRRRRQVVAA